MYTQVDMTSTHSRTDKYLEVDWRTCKWIRQIFTGGNEKHSKVDLTKYSEVDWMMSHRKFLQVHSNGFTGTCGRILTIVDHT